MLQLVLETAPFMYIKGIREILSYLVILLLLLKGDFRSTAKIFETSILVPLYDGLIFLRDLGFAPAIYIHWPTSSLHDDRCIFTFY